MQETGIEWARNPDGSQGYTFNPITGCLNHTGGLCKGGGFPCYAYKLATTRLKQRYLANGLVACDYEGGEDGSDAELKAVFNDPFYPRFWEERLYHPWGGEPKGIFVCDMSDLFGIGIPEEWTRTVLELCRKHEQNRYYLLTKQPQNLVKWSPFPENCWVGVTATNADMCYEAMDALYHITAKVKYVSFEPVLARMNGGECDDTYRLDGMKEAGITWLIIGACTGSWVDMSNLCMKHTNSLCNYQGLKLEQWGNKWTAQPRIEWVQEIVEAADRAGVPVFLKDNLKPMLPKEPPFYTKCCAEVNGKDPCYEEPCLSEHLVDECSRAPKFWMLRQEFPNTEEDAER